MLPCRPCGRVREFLHTSYGHTLRVCRLRMLSNLFRCKSLLVRCEFPNRARVRRFLDRSYKCSLRVCRLRILPNIFRCKLRAVLHGVLSHVPRGFRIFRYIFRIRLARYKLPCRRYDRAREFLHTLYVCTLRVCRLHILSNLFRCKSRLVRRDFPNRDRVHQFLFEQSISFRTLNNVCLR